MPADTTTFAYDEIHELYVRMSELAARLLEDARFPVIATDPMAGELLGQIYTVAAEAAKLKGLTRRLPWSIEEVWRDVLRNGPGRRQKV